MSIIDHRVALNSNVFTSPFQLFGITISSYYCFAYLAKKIENSMIGKVCAFIGENSFCIMGLHFVGFKLCSMFLTTVTGKLFATWCLTTPDLQTDWGYICLYFVFGVTIPLFVVIILNWLRNILRK